MRTWIVPLMVGVVVAGGRIVGAAESQNPASSPLEGTKWVVQMTPDTASQQKGEKSFSDTLVFENGKVWMTECTKAGFESSQYTLSPAGEAWTFATEQVSLKEGRSAWTAAIQNETIKGSMTWTKKDGSTINYDFEGVKEEASGQS